MAVTQGHKAAAYLAAQVSVAASDETLDDSGDQLTYVVNDAAKRFWDDTASVVVETSTDAGANWSTVDAGLYTVQHCGGKIIFAAAQNASHLFRADVSYLPITQIAEAHEWALDAELELLEDTVFGDTWKTQVPVLAGASASVKQWYADDTYTAQLGDRLVLILYTDYSGSDRYEAFAYLTGDSVSAVTSGLLEEELQFQISGEVYFEIA